MRGLAVSILLALAGPAAAAEFRSIAASGTLMYDAPSVRAKKLFVASRLYPVEIVINIDTWAKVRDHAGDLVWVEKKALSDKRTVIVTAAVAEADLAPILGIGCPSVLFPYARETVSDIIGRAGFPAVLLGHVNFEALFQQQRAGQSAAQPGGPRIEIAH